MTTPIDMPMMQEGNENLVLFYPHISEHARAMAFEQLGTRWIGQGPAVDLFERRFSETFCGGRATAAVGAGTDALHLAYLLAGLRPGDEVITPLFTCTATTIPLLYIGARPVFADVQPHSMNIDPAHVRDLVTERTKAIVCVHYGGLPCDMDELREIADEISVPIIEDAAHAVGASYHGHTIGSLSEFTMFSFQAIKHISTGDGGMLAVADPSLMPQARRMRWFGIDREGKQNATWDNDIWEVGYKYQMTDVAASMGLAALDEFDAVSSHRRALLAEYEDAFAGIDGIETVGAGYSDREHAAWLCTVLVDDRHGLQRKLRDNGVESNQVHYRNDRYSLFKESRGSFPNMDAVEDRYLVLPLHTRMGPDDAQRVIDLVRAGW